MDGLKAEKIALAKKKLKEFELRRNRENGFSPTPSGTSSTYNDQLGSAPPSFQSDRNGRTSVTSNHSGNVETLDAGPVAHFEGRNGIHNSDTIISIPSILPTACPSSSNLELENLRVQLQDRDQALQSLNKQLEELNGYYGQLHAAYTELSAKNVNISGPGDQIAQLQAALSGLVAEKTGLQAELRNAKEELEFLKHELEELESERRESALKLRTLNVDSATSSKRGSSSIEERSYRDKEAMGNELKNLRKESECEKFRHDVERLSVELEEAKREVNESRTQYNEYGTYMNENIARLNKELDESSLAKHTLETRLNEVENQLELAQQEKAENRKKLDSQRASPSLQGSSQNLIPSDTEVLKKIDDAVRRVTTHWEQLLEQARKEYEDGNKEKDRLLFEREASIAELQLKLRLSAENEKVYGDASTGLLSLSEQLQAEKATVSRAVAQNRELKEQLITTEDRLIQLTGEKCATELSRQTAEHQVKELQKQLEQTSSSRSHSFSPQAQEGDNNASAVVAQPEPPLGKDPYAQRNHVMHDDEVSIASEAINNDSQDLKNELDETRRQLDEVRAELRRSHTQNEQMNQIMRQNAEDENQNSILVELGASDFSEQVEEASASRRTSRKTNNPQVHHPVFYLKSAYAESIQRLAEMQEQCDRVERLRQKDEQMAALEKERERVVARCNELQQALMHVPAFRPRLYSHSTVFKFSGDEECIVEQVQKRILNPFRQMFIIQQKPMVKKKFDQLEENSPPTDWTNREDAVKKIMDIIDDIKKPIMPLSSLKLQLFFSKIARVLVYNLVNERRLESLEVLLAERINAAKDLFSKLHEDQYAKILGDWEISQSTSQRASFLEGGVGVCFNAPVHEPRALSEQKEDVVDGNYVLTCGSDKTIKLSNPNTGAHVSTFMGVGNEILGHGLLLRITRNLLLVDLINVSRLLMWRPGKRLEKYRNHAAKVNVVCYNEESETVSCLVDGYNCSRFYDVEPKMKKLFRFLMKQLMRYFPDTCKWTRYRGKIEDFLGESVTSIFRLLPDGNCILASTLDSTLRLMDKSRSGKCSHSDDLCCRWCGVGGVSCVRCLRARIYHRKMEVYQITAGRHVKSIHNWIKSLYFPMVSKLAFDRLVIATGARPKNPYPHVSRVLTLRDTETARHLERKIGRGSYELRKVEIFWCIREEHISAVYFDVATAKVLEDRAKVGPCEAHEVCGCWRRVSQQIVTRPPDVLWGLIGVLLSTSKEDLKSEIVIWATGLVPR
ncbi:unnamed protein product, partial [Mesorhabditis belari]|uniref:Uncharacterized protein n=1 Tax=Mesorhabditis belari TaxID=2138241 RepID=A0AAF3EPI4_9BILA